jgi:protein-disulfide isomerase
MTNSSGDNRLSKNARREAAREKARAIRAAQKKRERRSRLILQGSIGLVILAIVAIVAVVIATQLKPPAPGPRNMLSDGIKIGQDFEAVPTPGLEPGKEPVAFADNEPSDVFDIRVYVDYLCPVCGAFEAANAAQIKQLVADGAATVEIHPITILDRLSMGTKYSTRSANAAACVANYSPNNFFDFSALLFENQPKEGTEGLTDDQLVDLTKDAKVKSAGQIASCITGQEFKSWVDASTSRALDGPIPGTDAPKITGTPTVFVNGQQYKFHTDQSGAFDPKEFQAFMIQAAAQNYTKDPSPSPSPVPTPAP